MEGKRVTKPILIWPGHNFLKRLVRSFASTEDIKTPRESAVAIAAIRGIAGGNSCVTMSNASGAGN